MNSATSSSQYLEGPAVQVSCNSGWLPFGLAPSPCGALHALKHSIYLPKPIPAKLLPGALR